MDKNNQSIDEVMLDFVPGFEDGHVQPWEANEDYHEFLPRGDMFDILPDF